MTRSDNPLDRLGRQLATFLDEEVGPGIALKLEQARGAALQRAGQLPTLAQPAVAPAQEPPLPRFGGSD